MSEDKNQPQSLEERIAICPIHQWADIEDYLKRAEVPNNLWVPFHELVIARGKHPKYVSDKQTEKFGKEAVDITQRYEVLPIEAHALKIVFGQLIDQWMSAGYKNN